MLFLIYYFLTEKNKDVSNNINNETSPPLVERDKNDEIEIGNHVPLLTPSSSPPRMNGLIRRLSDSGLLLYTLNFIYSKF